MVCAGIRWQGRRGYSLSNGIVRLVVLTGGGHLAEFRFADLVGSSPVSPLWIPPWRTIEPYSYREHRHSQTYGSIVEGKLLSGLIGHNICLDYFGPPSDEEAKQGLSHHGEAPWSRWRKDLSRVSSSRLILTLSVKLPVCGLRCKRQIKLVKDESVVYFREVVYNERKADHFFQWAQHVTLGPPFLAHDDSVISMPATKGLTDPHGYGEHRALLAPNRTFQWPEAPLFRGGTVDLTRPFLRKGSGFVVALLLDSRRKLGYIAAINHKLNLVVGYCFSRSDFPWVAIWEENLALSAPPWRGRTRARGLEFTTTPLPVARRESFMSGKLFGQSTLTYIPARSSKTVQYLAFIARTPTGFGDIRDVMCNEEQIIIRGTRAANPIVLKASGASSVAGLST